MTVKQAIKFGHNALKEGSSTSLTDTKVLLQHVLGVDRAGLQARLGQILTDNQFRSFQNHLAKRQRGEPIAYIIGRKEFYGIEYYVDRRVLVPRPETELLVEQLIKTLGSLSGEKLLFVDIGTGSGNIACTVARLTPLLPVIATDISKDAILVASRNARNVQVEQQIDFRVGNLLEPIADDELSGHTVVMAANLPYVPARYKVAPDLHYEPGVAIFAGEEGVECYREFLEQIRERPIRELILFLEMHHDQGKTLRAMAEEFLPGAAAEISKDYAGHDRVMRLELRRLLA